MHGQTWVFFFTLLFSKGVRSYLRIRRALHKVITQERPVGGERGGVSYILKRFMIQDSESTRLRTKGPGGLLVLLQLLLLLLLLLTTHPLAYPFTSLLTHSLAYWCLFTCCSPNNLFTQSLIHSLTHSRFTHPLLHFHPTTTTTITTVATTISTTTFTAILRMISNTTTLLDALVITIATMTMMATTTSTTTRHDYFCHCHCP